MHASIKQKLEKHIGLDKLDQLPPEWAAFVASVSELYDEKEAKKIELKESLEDSANELITRNEELRNDLVKREETELALRQSQKELRTQKVLFENLVAIAQASSQRLNLEDTLRNVLNVSVSLTRAHNSSLFLFDTRGNVSHSIRSDNPFMQEYTDHTAVVMKSGLARWVYETRQLALLPDTYEDERWMVVENTGGYQARSALAMPIAHGEILLGILTLTHGSPQHFTVEHAELMQTAADQMALALINAQIYEQQASMAEQQIALYSFLQMLGDLLDTDQIAQLAVESVVQMTKWTAAVIFMLDETGQGLQIRASFGHTGLTEGHTIGIDQGICGHAFSTAQVQMVYDALQDPHYDPASDDVIPHVQLAIPLKRADTILGVLSVSMQFGRKFRQDDVIFTESLSETITLSLDKALAYEKLYEAKEAADYANQAKTEFISIVSHELKTPMTSIKGFTDLMLTQAAGPLTEKQYEFLRTIVSNVDRMKNLVSDLTDISRIESGHYQMEPTRFDISLAVEDVARGIRSQIQTKSQRLEIEAAATLPPVWADRNRVMQILTNLISNANKYTPEEGLILVKLWQETAVATGLPMMHIAVKDNGIGITAEDQEKMFQKFFRSEDAQARLSPGTGLGMNITKNLVEMQGGTIWFESVFRNGTTFHFTLPIAVPEPIPQEAGS